MRLSSISHNSTSSVLSLSPQEDELLDQLVSSLNLASNRASLSASPVGDFIASSVSKAVGLRRRTTLAGSDTKWRNRQWPIKYRGAHYLTDKRITHLEIASEDVERLDAEVFLNDVIINVGLRMWWSDIGARKASRVHVFNSYFYKQLSQYGFSGVRSWYPKTLFNAGCWLVPVHSSLHWYLLVVCLKPRVKIFTMDSYFEGAEAPMHEQPVAEVFDFLLKAYACNPVGKYSSNVAVLNASSNLSRLYKAVTVPRQPNEFDCGLYLLDFAKKVMCNPDACVREVMRSTHTQASFWDGNLVGDLRQELRSRILSISS